MDMALHKIKIITILLPWCWMCQLCPADWHQLAGVDTNCQATILLTSLAMFLSHFSYLTLHFLMGLLLRPTLTADFTSWHLTHHSLWSVWPWPTSLMSRLFVRRFWHLWNRRLLWLCGAVYEGAVWLLTSGGSTGAHRAEHLLPVFVLCRNICSCYAPESSDLW